MPDDSNSLSRLKEKLEQLKPLLEDVEGNKEQIEALGVQVFLAEE